MLGARVLNHIDCFSGVGGVATGFRAAGAKTLLAVEKVESCVETYTANHPETPVLNTDIRSVGIPEVQRHLSGRRVDLITAGMPCETFSTAGASSRSFYDHRQVLFEEAIRIADFTQARMVMFENVPGFANKRLSKTDPALVIEVLRERLDAHGFSNRLEVVLNAKDFGVPQSRQRLFVIASKDMNIKLSAPAPSGKAVTVGEAFANLPVVDTAGPTISQEFQNVTNHYCELMGNHDFWRMSPEKSCTYQKSPKHRPGTIERFKLIGLGEGLKSLFDRYDPDTIADLQLRKILPKKWYIQRNRRLSFGDVSPTVTSHCIDELLHPSLHRAITVREAARLQSFPDAYNFVGGPEICPHVYETQDKYEQIGDAVPPLLAYHWANHLVQLVLGNSSAIRQQSVSSVCEAI